MLLPPFEFHQPRSVGSLCKLLGEYGRQARIIAGGTDLMVNMKKGLVKPKHVISLKGVKNFGAISFSPKKGLTIGCQATAAKIAAHPDVIKNYPALAHAASVLGSPLVRNLATAAGNLVTARPAADFPPPLMVYGASVELVSADDKRTVELDKFITGVGKTRAKAGEVLTKIMVPPTPKVSGAHYIKLGQRKTLEISLVNVAAFVELSGDGETVVDSRIVLGSVAPKPIRAKRAERYLVNKQASMALFEEAAKIASDEAKPIDDFRGSALYRRLMVEVLTRRCLEASTDQALAGR